MSETNTTTTGSAPGVEPTAGPARPSPRRFHGPGLVPIAIVVAILGGGVLFTTLTSNVTKVSEPGVRLVNDEPVLEETAGNWKGGPAGGLSEEERTLLPGAKGVRRLYTDSLGNQVFCSIILAGKDVAAIHRPEMCLSGQGWKLLDEHVESVDVPTVAGGNLEVTRMNMVHSDQGKDTRAIFTYWFVGKNRRTPHHWQRLLWNAEDRVLHDVNHRWAYIMIHSPVMADLKPGGMNPEETMRMLKDFIRAVYPTLNP